MSTALSCACWMTMVQWRERDCYAKRVHGPSVRTSSTLAVQWHAWRRSLRVSVLFDVTDPYTYADVPWSDCSQNCCLACGKAARSPNHIVARVYYVRSITYALHTVYVEHDSARRRHTGSFYMCDVQKVKIVTPRRNSITLNTVTRVT